MDCNGLLEEVFVISFDFRDATEPVRSFFLTSVTNYNHLVKRFYFLQAPYVNAGLP